MQQTNRLISLDVFRGITIAAMVLVNNPGSWSTVYPPLLHAKWNGCTPTDLIFPFFVFIVGVSIVLAYTKRLSQGASHSHLIKKLVFRAFKIFILGVFLNGFPYFDFTDIRIPGVLQRIALVFLVCGLLFIKTKWKTQAIIGVVLLLLYWFLMTVVPVPGVGPANLEPTTNLGAWLDNLLLGGHLWRQSEVWDPEGLLSTMPAVVTGICGMLTGHLLSANLDKNLKVIWLFVAGSLSIFIGLVWDIYFPINKMLWTSAYVLYTAGIALEILALIYWFVDVKGYSTGTKPFIAYGSNAITLYVLSGLISKILGMIQVGESSLHAWIYQNLFLSWLGDYFASFMFALTTQVLFLLIIAWWLHKKKIFIKL